MKATREATGTPELAPAISILAPAVQSSAPGLQVQRLRPWTLVGLALFLTSAGSAKAQASASPASPVPAEAMSLEGKEQSKDVLSGAEDAFGSTVGREQVGIYSITAVRGFDPTVAGNVRVSGIYADLPGGISDHVIANLLIRVGLANLGTLLAAPSGIADVQLKRPGKAAVGQLRVSTDDLGFSGVELDIDTPIINGLGLNGGASAWGLGNDSNGLRPRRREFGAVLTAGRDDCAVQAFVSSSRSSEAVYPRFYPDAGFSSQRLPRDTFLGHRWNRLTSDDHGAGIVGQCQASGHIHLAGGITTGRNFVTNDSFDLVQHWQGRTGERLTFLMPPHSAKSLSGEAQVDWTVANHGKWNHQFSLGWRGRTSSARYGGEVLVVHGPWQQSQSPAPSPGPVAFGPQTVDRSSQSSLLLGWKSEKTDLGIVKLVLAPTQYLHRVELPLNLQAGGAETTRVLLYSGLAALHLSKRTTAFIAASRGIEDSGFAPLSASNRGEVLPAATSRQAEIGVRTGIGKLTANLAGFSITKPYAEEGADGRYTLSGLVRHRGLEVSLAGPLMPGLDLVAGFALIDARLKISPGLPNARPVAVPLAIGQIGVDWAMSPKLSIDSMLTLTGSQWLQPDGSLRLPATAIADIGLRYQPRIAGHDYTLRLRVTNLTNAYQWNAITDGGLSPGKPRRISLSLAYQW